MKPVYQIPLDGQCVRACLASIFEIPIDVIPSFQCEGHTYSAEKGQFICTIPEHKSKHSPDRYDCDDASEQDRRIQEWANQFGLKFVGMYMDSYGPECGPRRHGDYHLLPPGYCIASGPSPRGPFHHAVVWDTRLRDFEHPYGRMVHDPNPDPEGNRPGIKYVERFEWFEVEDPSKLHQ